MHRNAQLDRRRPTPQSLRHQSSTLSSDDYYSDEVPQIDIYSTSIDDQQEQEKKPRTRSTVASLWRSVRSLNLFGRENQSHLPRYDIHASAAEADRADDDDDVQLIAVSSPGRQDSEEMDYSPSDTSSYDSEDMMEGQPSDESTSRAEEVLLFEKGSNKPRHAWILRRKPTFKAVDVDEYMAKREMTALQEKWNALTMIPHPVLCAYYIWSCVWIPASMLQQMREEVQISGSAWPAPWIGDPSECLPQTWGLLSLPYMPPAPVLAIALGVTLHTPWSMLYHWKFAHQLPAGAPRTNHWSRRMDQAMMHIAAALLAFGTSGSWDYMIATGLFNVDSAYRHFKPKVAPRRNKVRITLAIIAYSIPLLRHGHADLFLQFWAAMSVCMWLFATYPIGGWSHAVFHVVAVATLIPLLQAASLAGGAAQESVQMAAQCTVWNQSA